MALRKAAERSLRRLNAKSEARARRWPAKSELEGRCTELDEALSASELSPVLEVGLLMERASLHTDLGRPRAAQADRLRILELDPKNRENLFDLGRLLVTAGQSKAAQIVYQEGLKFYPEEIAFMVNLGSVLLQRDDAAGARAHYEAALRLDSEFIQAHGGMYYALSRLGEFSAAAVHRERAFRGNYIFESPYRGDQPGIPLLLLVSSTGGNTPIERLLDESIFQAYVVVADFLQPETKLPAHRLVVNGIGDADVSSEALQTAQKVFDGSVVPVLNRPERVLATGRAANADRLAGVSGLVTAKTATFPYEQLAGKDGVQCLTDAGFSFPLLLRVPGYHMGQHFVRVDEASGLGPNVAQLPGEGRAGAELLAIEYLDARGADGCARKYRVMMVDGQLYPLHLAISENWKIHYFSADMADRADHRAEEARFLEDMASALGPKAMAALKGLQGALGLDYAGVDFGLNAEGEVLVFEANATMVVEQPNDDPKWEYRRAVVHRIHGAVRNMLLSRSSHSAGLQLVPRN
jgi:tetratricopeptide (TPR) repeat protein